jgi:small-conductance mechanosensitive channel
MVNSITETIKEKITDLYQNKLYDKKFIILFFIIFVVLFLFFAIMRIIGQFPILIVITILLTYYFYNLSNKIDIKNLMMNNYS